MSKILVFDIGGVIIFHDNAYMLKRLISRMNNPPDEEKLLIAIRSNGIGTGTATVLQLWKLLVKDFSLTGTYDDFLSDWSSHFSPNEAMLETIRVARSDYPVVLCSNTNTEHWLALCDRYSLESICQKAILSFEVGIEKPDNRIYANVEQLFPHATRDSFIFVDDNYENVESAKRFGFRGHHYLDHSAFLNELRDWNISIHERTE